MAQAYDVLWAEAAKNDLREIIRYISAENPKNASKILRRIKKSAADLNMSPERGRVVPELMDQGVLLYRELIVAPWRLMYRISDRKVYILAVLDGRQNIEDILLKRLTYRHR